MPEHDDHDRDHGHRDHRDHGHHEHHHGGAPVCCIVTGTRVSVPIATLRNVVERMRGCVLSARDASNLLDYEAQLAAFDARELRLDEIEAELGAGVANLPRAVAARRAG